MDSSCLPSIVPFAPPIPPSTIDLLKRAPHKPMHCFDELHNDTLAVPCCARRGPHRSTPPPQQQWVFATFPPEASHTFLLCRSDHVSDHLHAFIHNSKFGRFEHFVDQTSGHWPLLAPGDLRVLPIPKSSNPNFNLPSIAEHSYTARWSISLAVFSTVRRTKCTHTSFSDRS